MRPGSGEAFDQLAKRFGVHSRRAVVGDGEHSPHVDSVDQDCADGVGGVDHPVCCGHLVVVGKRVACAAVRLCAQPVLLSERGGCGEYRVDVLAGRREHAGAGDRCGARDVGNYGGCVGATGLAGLIVLWGDRRGIHAGHRGSLSYFGIWVTSQPVHNR
ncbi:hypothetical protein FXN61_11930 [Lentzea sp. PSKA42]|uniref:Uncharacterized protein n=1 Tax=Lentzea indica TaxID=2604800 RepID=A0ABX1FEY9_9PSEU|nr:hypothetical protein [Lentzea indica]NKE57505.1 hypothetical protein [Lentzea indica]